MKRTTSGTAVNSQLERLVAPHVESFNYFLEQGLATAIAFLDPVALSYGDVQGKRGSLATPLSAEDRKTAVSFYLEGVQIGQPAHADSSLDDKVYPSECRQGGLTYAAPFFAKVVYRDHRGKHSLSLCLSLSFYFLLSAYLNL